MRRLRRLCRRVVQQIEDTHNANQIPIVVGGTSYWIQHLIFPERMASLEKSENTPGQQEPSSPPSESFKNALGALPPELLDLFNNLPEHAPRADDDIELSHRLHDLLMALDPLVAQRWHWRDTRKVLTNLRVIQENRRLASEVIREQSKAIPKPRYFCTVYCQLHLVCFNTTSRQISNAVLLALCEARCAEAPP